MKAILAACMTAILCCGCAVTKSTFRPEAKLVRHSRVSVEFRGPDYTDVVDELEAMLLERGFEVVSHSFSRTAMVTRNLGAERSRGTYEESQSAWVSGSQTFAVRAVPGDYVISVNALVVPEITGPKFLRFYASVVDMDTGRVVGTFTAKQSAFGFSSTGAILKQFVNTL